MKSKQSSGPEERTFGREMDINNGEAGQPGATTILLQVSSTGKDVSTLTNYAVRNICEIIP